MTDKERIADMNAKAQRGYPDRVHFCADDVKFLVRQIERKESE